MKKLISIMMAFAMVLALFACSGKTSTQQGASPSEEAGVSPDSSPAASASPGAVADVSENADEVGYFEDGVDPYSRKTYNIVFAYPGTLLLFEKMAQSFNDFSKKLNFKLTTMTTEYDMDKYVSNIQVLVGEGDVDGFIVCIQPEAADRIKEVLDESKIPYISLFNSVRDSSGSNLVPCIGLDQKAAGATTMQWLYDNYKKYWGNIDETQIGLLNMTYSINVDLQDRHDGAEAKFKELLPNNTKIFSVDAATSSESSFETTGYNQAAAVFAANPDVKYWFVTCCLEMLSQGAARAAESLGMEDRVLITDVGSDILCSEWDNGYNGCWVSCLAISNYLYAAPTICGLIAMIDGKATPESLWQSRRAPGDRCTFYCTDSMMVTKDTYKSYFNGIAEKLGMPLPYPA